MLHRILELTYRRAADPSDTNDCLNAMEAAAGEVLAGAPREYGFRPSPLWLRQQRELRKSLQRTIEALAEASHGYVPRRFEAQFGIEQPPLSLPTAVGEVRLRGYIDRIDSGPDGRLRVIDYKSSGTPISRQDLAEGRRLQLPLYALAARDALKLGQIEGGFYWHIHRAEASALKLETCEGGVEGALNEVVQHVAHHIGGIRGGRFKPHPPPEGCPGYCPATAFCWRYAPREF
jgi:ATP-dependent helicase/DNAse subunit B